jgi:hypothetical protein
MKLATALISGTPSTIVVELLQTGITGFVDAVAGLFV